MSLEENKAIIRRGIEETNKQNLSAIEKFIAPDYVDHTNPLRGLEDVKRFYSGVFKDIPDFHRSIEDIIAEGDKVWARFKITGTTAGKKIELETVAIFHIQDGKIVEGWSVPSQLAMRNLIK